MRKPADGEGRCSAGDGRKRILLLGATGSIGKNTLDVLRMHPERFELIGAAAGSSWEAMREVLGEFAPPCAAMSDEQAARRLQEEAPSSWKGRVFSGPDALLHLVEEAEWDVVVAATSGSVGLRAAAAVLERGGVLALANKEVMVAAGEWMSGLARRNGAVVLPVDSEHSAIFQSLRAGRQREVARLILTASGGPFRVRTREQLENVRVEDALAHPNWDMGAKITIDSATLFNKGLEVIEARWLFDVDYDRIEVLVHPQSIVHSMVEFVDASVIAQMGVPDMRVPIMYALSWPERLEMKIPGLRLDLASAGMLTFEKPDLRTFPALGLAYEAGRRGGGAPTVLNAANEEAVQAFLDGRISFLAITEVVERTLDSCGGAGASSLDEVLETDAMARRRAREIIAEVSA